MTTAFHDQYRLDQLEALDRAEEPYSYDREIDRLREVDEAGFGTDTWPENTIVRLNVYLTRRPPRIAFADLPKDDQDYLLALGSHHSSEKAVDLYLERRKAEAEVDAFVADCEERLRRPNEHRTKR